MKSRKQATADLLKAADQASAELEKARGQASLFLRRHLPQVIVQGVIIVAVAIGSYFLMTWIIADLAGVDDTYLAALFEALGTLFMMVITLVSVNTFVYRRRFKEIDTLSEAISSVSAGNFDYRIAYKPRDPMMGVYENFNKMTSELSSVQLLQNDFINNYSHEFKTPIASINGFAELLLERDLPEKERREYLTIIRDESERLSSLATDTILLSKLTTQQILSEVDNYNLGEQLRQCAIICSSAWMDKKQEFDSELPDIEYVGDKELLTHLWLNLLGNAVKYTPDGGSIFLSLTEEDDKVIVRVSDTGYGMDEETLAHLFDPYFQGDASHSAHGLGLGLSICKRIVELCEGEIAVESTLGEGSTFIVSLPKDFTQK